MQLIKLHRLEESYPNTEFIEEIFLNPSKILYISKQKVNAINLGSICENISSVDSSFNKFILDPSIITLTDKSNLLVAESVKYINQLLLSLK